MHHTFEYRTPEVRWAIGRNLKIKSIQLFADILGDDGLCVELVMSLAGPALECVILSSYDDNDIEDDISLGVERFIMVMAASCPNLASFCIESETEFITIKDHLLVTLLSRCKKLQTLQLQNCNCGNNALLRALYTAPNLHTIVLTGGHNPDRVQNIPKEYANHTVTHLNLRDSTFSEASGSHVGYVCAHFPNLISFEASEVTNERLEMVAKCCPLLQNVCIYVHEVIQEETALQAARQWPQLRTLAMHCTAEPDPIDGDDEPEVFLDPSCTEAALLCFIRNCPKLTSLNTVCRGHTYKTVTQSLNSIPAEGDGSSLCELYVDSLSIRGFQEIQTLCKHLHTLGIHHENPYYFEGHLFETVEARPLETALRSITNSSVKVLYIYNYCALSVENVDQLAGNLREIHLSDANSNMLSGKHILRLVARCPELRVFDLQNCFIVQDNFVLPLLDLCPTLTSLNIRNNRKEFDFMRRTPSTRMLEELLKRTHPQLEHFKVDCKFFN